MDEPFESYGNELQDFYERVVSCLDDEKDYRKKEGLSEEEYLFKNIKKVPSIQEHYKLGKLNELMEEFPETTFAKINGLVKKINDFLEEENENIYFLDSLVSDLYYALNRKSLK